MNRSDLDVALSFLEPSDVPETVVLQCYRAKDIPFVKRLLRHTLGDPSMMMSGHAWRYGKKIFEIKPVASDLHGYIGKVFYISYEDGHDWYELLDNWILDLGSNTLAPYLLHAGFDYGDAYRAMVGDGHSTKLALAMLDACIWAEV